MLTKNVTAQKMKFSIKDTQFPVDLVTFTQEILNEKLHCLCSVSSSLQTQILNSLEKRIVGTFSKSNMDI